MKEHFSPQSFTCNDNVKIWLYKLIAKCYEKKIRICLDKEEIRSFQLNGESVPETAGKIEALKILMVVSLTLLFSLWKQIFDEACRDHKQISYQLANFLLALS